MSFRDLSIEEEPVPSVHNGDTSKYAIVIIALDFFYDYIQITKKGVGRFT